MKLNNGDVIIFPTDTVYGIGAMITDYLGMDKIYEIKKRPKEKRLSVLCANIDDIESIAYVTEDAKRLIKNYMPGGLTLILNSKEEIRNDFDSPHKCDNIILLCYEKSGDFCHRHILADWLEENFGYKVKEYQ